MQLKHVKKYAPTDGNVSTRVKSAASTLKQILPICKKIGVTRISDITYMDRLYIPNYSAILPGTEDSIWVYGGKGSTRTEARASALMESIERYFSLPSTYSKSFVKGTYAQLSKINSKVLHPDEVVEPTKRTYNDDESILDYIPGFDLMNNEEVLVPAQLVFSKFSAKSPSIPAFLYSHTNGLASGNVLEEAISHGLCEVIERDATSIAELLASSIPFSVLEKVITSLKSDNIRSRFTQFLEENFVDDPSVFPEVDISGVAKEYESIRFLVKKFTDADIPLLIKEITQKDIGIPTFVASSIEWITSDYGYFAKGYGTHPDSRIALTRAISELSQTRAANIQGARDDLKKIQYGAGDEIYNRKWQFMPPSSSNLIKSNNKPISFYEIRTFLKDDILEDIQLILNRLKKAGLKRAIIVDLTNPNGQIPVVRVIVPGLETFEVAKLFTNSHLFMGRRAKKHFRQMLGS
jgi:thioglycine synthase